MYIALIAKILIMILQLFKYLLIARILLSWFPQVLHSGNPIIIMLIRITDPPMFYTRKWLPFLQLGFIDLSPIVLFIAINYLIHLCLQVVFNYSF